MATTPTDVIALIGDELLPAWTGERRKLDRIDRWARWDHDTPHRPKKATKEYKELAARAQAPWGDLIVGSIAQTLYVEGYRRPDAPEDATGWGIWQANGMDGRQVALHRAILTYGLAYVTVLPGKTLAGEPMPTMRGVSPREMITAYEDPAVDDWPVYALRISRIRKGFRLQLLDSTQVHAIKVENLSDKMNPGSIVTEEHNAGACPVVRYENRFDLEGRAAGEIEPFIPLLGRNDQTTMDRLVVQRFGAWVVRTIAGMDVPASADAAGESVNETKLRLSIEDFLTAVDKDTKFGSLAATPLEGFIKAGEADKIDLAAVSQTPAFELLGQMANLSAEALAAAKASQTAKSDERKHTVGEKHEQSIRLGSHIAGDIEGAADFMAEVRWADTSIRSLSQAVDAYGKMKTMLDYPGELLWGKVPGFTRQDVDEAKQLLAQGGDLEALLRELGDGQTSAMDPDEIKQRADAMGVLIRAGVKNDDAARMTGLAGVDFTGVPVSVRVEETVAAPLEPK